MARATPQQGNPDAIGLAVAKVAQDAVAPDTVILFGSRARGDHRPDSDIDLMVVTNGITLTAMATARHSAKAYFEVHPSRLGIDVASMERENFQYARRARNHMAGQATKAGTIMNGQELESNGRQDDGYPASWPNLATHRSFRILRADYLQSYAAGYTIEFLEGPQLLNDKPKFVPFCIVVPACSAAKAYARNEIVQDLLTV